MSVAGEKVDAEKTEFYTVAKISIEAAIRYIKKYSDRYKKAAGEESDCERAAEFELIAKLLKTVSTGKVTSFCEAMQLMWINHIIGNTALGSALSFARFDQYMYPFYKADREAGRITEDEAREPLSDGPGPVQGKDTEGPTKLFNSMLKFDYSYMTGAYATNYKLNPSLFGTESGSLAFKNMVKAYLKSGGPQVQVNVVRQEDLINAQKNPHEHRDVFVRITGFCEYFVNLDYIQQNEIIKRTEHEIA